MNCKQCNQQISDDAAFCPYCGAKIPQNTSTIKAELNEKIKKYKKIIKYSIYLFMLLILASLYISTFLAFFFGATYIAVISFIQTKVTRLDRELSIITDNKEKNSQTLPLNKTDCSSTNDSKTPLPKVADAAQSTLNAENNSTTPTETTTVLNTKKESASEEIESYLKRESFISLVIGAGILVFSLIIMFVPFFDLIIKNVSVYQLTESIMLWNKGKEGTDLLSNILTEAYKEGFILPYLSSNDLTYLVNISFLGLLLFSAGLPLSMLTIFYNKYRYETNNRFKSAILHKFCNNEVVSQKKSIVMIMGVTICIMLLAPAFDLLFCLYKYFDEFANPFYIIAVTCLTILDLIAFIRFAFYSKKRWRLMCAFITNKL